MRIIAWSDLHSDEHEDFSYQLPDGTNSRLADCLTAIDKVAYYRDKYKCDVVLFAGDMFHTPHVLSTTVFQETYKHLEKLAESSNQMIVLAGNHDMSSITADGKPVSTVYALRRLPNTKVIVGKYVPFLYAERNIYFHCLPYIKDPEALEKEIKSMKFALSGSNPGGKHSTHIIVTHIALAQAVNGPNEIKLKKAFDVNVFRKMGAQKILSGHHHHPQDEGNWSVIGSPLQMNMNDRGDRRGVLIYDTTTNKTKRIWFSGSRFFLYTIDSTRKWEKFLLDQDKIKGGYVRVMYMPGVVDESALERVLKSTAKMYKMLPVASLSTVERSTKVTQKAMANVSDLSAVIPDYVEHVNPKGLNRNRLVRIGRKLAKGD